LARLPPPFAGGEGAAVVGLTALLELEGARDVLDVLDVLDEATGRLTPAAFGLKNGCIFFVDIASDIGLLPSACFPCFPSASACCRVA
jgi:hypothetical protein